MNVLSVVARLKAAPGKGAFQALLVEQAGVVRAAEPGCLVYRVHRSTTDPDVFLFYETYADDAAFETGIAARRIWPLTASAARAKASRRDPRRWKCSVRAANEARGTRAAASALIRA